MTNKASKLKDIGYVQWFDEQKGEGMILNAKTGESLYFHYSSIIERQEDFKFFKMIRNLKKHQGVIFSVYENLYMRQVDGVIGLDYFHFEDQIKLNDLMNILFENGDGNALLVSAA